jgi:hypothetical protein
VAGAAFHLVHPVGSPRPRIGWVGRLEGDLIGFDVGGELDGDLQPAVLLHDGVTDAHGRAELRGPGDVELVLRIHGDASRVVDRVALGHASPLLVELPAAGGVRGCIGPPALLAALRALPARSPGERAGAIRIGFGAESDVAAEARGERVETEVGPDGRFDQQRLAPGTWKLSLSLRARQSGLSLEHWFATVRVRAGVTVEQDAQLPELLPGTVRGVVTAGGAPVERGELTLFAAPEHAGTRRPVRCTVGAGGRFELVVLPATYRAALAVPGAATFSTEQQLAVGPGAAVLQDLDFAAGRARLRVLDPQGRAAVGIEVRVARDGRSVAHPSPTDRGGVAELMLPPGTYEVHCWRRELQHEAARAAFERTRPTPEQLAKARFVLGTIELLQGKVVGRDLRLPEAWSR